MSPASKVPFAMSSLGGGGGGSSSSDTLSTTTWPTWSPARMASETFSVVNGTVKSTVYVVMAGLSGVYLQVKSVPLVRS